jgi:ATP adenylyltransferase
VLGCNADDTSTIRYPPTTPPFVPLPAMERLWSPWRSEVISSYDDINKEESPFTRAFNQPDKDAEHHLVHRGRLAFIIMNKYPYNAGHLLILPVREVGGYLDLTDEERHEMSDLIAFGIEMLKRAMNPHAFNVGMNLGREAGAGINSHVHFHIVPRWNGDTNFMPVFDETRVISEDMDVVYGKLVEARDALLNERGGSEQ